MRKLAQEGLYKFYTVKTLSNRKKIMINRSDAFLILPGGFGTLDELLEVLTLKQLGLNNKPIIIFNIHGFWNPLKKFFLFMKKEGFVKHKDIKHIFWANSTDEILNFIDNNFNYLIQTSPISIVDSDYIGEIIVDDMVNMNQFHYNIKTSYVNILKKKQLETIE